MFEFFKRSAPKAAKPAPRRKSSAKSRSFDARAEPPPLPEVTEGNEQTDWALWEDSVVALDSQMQSLGFAQSKFDNQPTAPSELQDIDAFSRVTRKDD